MTVIKRSGREEEFDINKITIALESTSDSIGQPLTGGDIKSICRETLSQLGEKEKVRSKEIYSTLVKVLIEKGFSDIAKEYINSERNAWGDNLA